MRKPTEKILCLDILQGILITTMKISNHNLILKTRYVLKLDLNIHGMTYFVQIKRFRGSKLATGFSHVIFFWYKRTTRSVLNRFKLSHGSGPGSRWLI